MRRDEMLLKNKLATIDFFTCHALLHKDRTVWLSNGHAADTGAPFRAFVKTMQYTVVAPAGTVRDKANNLNAIQSQKWKTKSTKPEVAWDAWKWSETGKYYDSKSTLALKFNEAVEAATDAVYKSDGITKFVDTESLFKFSATIDGGSDFATTTKYFVAPSKLKVFGKWVLLNLYDQADDKQYSATATDFPLKDDVTVKDVKIKLIDGCGLRSVNLKICLAHDDATTESTASRQLKMAGSGAHADARAPLAMVFSSPETGEVGILKTTRKFYIHLNQEVVKIGTPAITVTKAGDTGTNIYASLLTGDGTGVKDAPEKVWGMITLTLNDADLAEGKVYTVTIPANSFKNTAKDTLKWPLAATTFTFTVKAAAATPTADTTAPPTPPFGSK